MNEIGKDVTSIALAIVGVAVLAVLVSRNSNTSGVVGAASSAYNSGLATAMGPVTGYTPGPPVYAGSGGGFGFGGTGIGGSVGMLEPGAGYTGGSWG